MTDISQPATYNGTLGGTTAFFDAGATATYTSAVTYTEAYDLNTVTYSYSGGTLASQTTGTVPTPSAVDLTSWTVTWSISDETYATIDSSTGTLTVKSTLPATFATATVSYTATDGVNIVTASLPVTIYASEAVLEGVVGGTQGVSNGVVTLNDYEDHSWSYYSDATLPQQMRSLNPANVKITYYGNGQTDNNMTTTDTKDVPTAFGAKATGVQVGIGEPGHTFVYYKTLERTDGSTSANPTGRCLYRTILNPFSIRPTYGTGTDRWRGFYKWRVKSVSGGTIYDAATGGDTINAGGTIDAETDIYFAPTSEYGMAVELEALWAAAAVSTSGVPATYSSVERNFYVGTTNVFTGGNPGTCSSFYPNGTTDGIIAATLADRSSITAGTAGSDKRIEYYVFSSGTVNTGGYKLDIGRGVTCSGNVLVIPLSGTHSANKNARLRLESGTYGGGTLYLYGTPTVSSYLVHLDLILGNDYDRAQGDNDKLFFATGSTIQHGGHTANNASWLSFQHLDIVVKSGSIQKNYWAQNSANYEYTFYCRSVINGTSGRYPGISYLTVEGGEFASVNGGRGNYATDVALEDDIVFSMRMKGGTVHGSIYGAASANPSFGGRRVVITGGTVEGWIAGGCDGTSNGGGATIGDSYIYAGGKAVIGTSTRSVIDGTEAGNIFGAGRGMSNHGASDQPASMRNAHIAVADEATVLRNVYGGGEYGYTGYSSSSAETDAATAANIYILGGTVEQCVYGGGNRAKGTNTNIIMTGGLVKGGVYGGSNNTGTIQNNSTLRIDGGQVGVGSGNVVSQKANIHGGGYGQATQVQGNVKITLGTCGAASGATVYGDVYVGSALGSVGTNTSNSHTLTLYKGTVYGGLYGGGLGQRTGFGGATSDIAATVNGNTRVAVAGGSVLTTSADPEGELGTGSVFGCNNLNGSPTGTVRVDIYGTDQPATGYALHAVYGGGNLSDYVPASNAEPTVTIHGCDNRIEYVYGGGNASDVWGTNVTVWGGTIGNVFGGGNGYSASGNRTDITAAHYNPGANIRSGDVNLTIHGGSIGYVFGGSNQYGYISDQITVNVSALTETGSDTCGNDYEGCAMQVGRLYGGGNEAPIQAYSGSHAWLDNPTLNIDCSAEIGMLFGGARKADYGKDITLVIDAGKFDKVFGGNDVDGTISGNVSVTHNAGQVGDLFGGNNEGGDITGSITVTVDSSGAQCTYPFRVGNVYGGGYMAGYTPAAAYQTGYPQVNIYRGTVRESVYGGGYGSGADVESSPKVTVGGTNGTAESHSDVVKVQGNVFGGGNAADVKQDTHVIVCGDAEVMGNVYGGGNQAGVDGDTKVEIK